MSGDSYYVGEKPRFPAEFRVGATLTDPTEVKFIRQKPGAAVEVFVYGVDGELVRDSAGKYHIDWLIDEYVEGWWTWRLESSGVVDSAVQGRFRVRPEVPEEP